jgi:hypothetical protein
MFKKLKIKDSRFKSNKKEDLILSFPYEGKGRKVKLKVRGLPPLL